MQNLLFKHTIISQVTVKSTNMLKITFESPPTPN